MNHLFTIWKFTRPHTIIGTIVSVSTLFIIATSQYLVWPQAFWLALLSAVLCNVFITGYNQLVDVNLDRINKPYLPLASGEMSILTGKKIVWSCLIVSLAIAYYLSHFFFALVVVISIIGFLYSWKNVYLKKDHKLAAIAITLVRGFLINAGFYLYFSGYNADIGAVSNTVWLLIFFVAFFSVGISWFKDIPDVSGDKTRKIASMAINLGVKRAFTLGVSVVAAGYSITAFAPAFISLNDANGSVITFGTAISGFIFLGMSSKVDAENQRSIKRFYLTFWGLFVLEYLIFAFAAIS